LLSKMI